MEGLAAWDGGLQVPPLSFFTTPGLNEIEDTPEIVYTHTIEEKN